MESDGIVISNLIFQVCCLHGGAATDNHVLSVCVCIIKPIDINASNFKGIEEGVDQIWFC